MLVFFLRRSLEMTNGNQRKGCRTLHGLTQCKVLQHHLEPLHARSHQPNRGCTEAGCKMCHKQVHNTSRIVYHQCLTIKFAMGHPSSQDEKTNNTQLTMLCRSLTTTLTLSTSSQTSPRIKSFPTQMFRQISTRINTQELISTRNP